VFDFVVNTMFFLNVFILFFFKTLHFFFFFIMPLFPPIEKCVLLVVDIQERLVSAISDKRALARMISAVKIFQV